MPTHLRDQTLSDGRSQLSRSLSPSLLMSATNNNNNNNDDDDVSSSNRMNEMATVLLSDDDEEACHLKQGKQIARSKSIHRRSASYGNPLQISTNIASTLHNMASVDDTTDTATPTTPTTPTTPLKTKKPMDSKTMAKMKRKSIEFSNNLTCVICCDYYQQPVRLRRCRHLFCRPCILASLARTSTCPICRTKTRQRDLVPSVRTGKLVDAYK
ncbi:hypothetical protein BDF19DRAFT_327304 [Syncephalis fuscata]|nr:hypothetical protein BDF19DRAFT_327304 [Syncephalis fuscata]